MTKLHEEIRVTTVGEANAYYKENPPRGEFGLVMAGAPPEAPPEQTLEDAVAAARRRMAAGESAAAAAKYAAAHSAFSKSEIYRRCMEAEASAGEAGGEHRAAGLCREASDPPKCPEHPELEDV